MTQFDDEKDGIERAERANRLRQCRPYRGCCVHGNGAQRHQSGARWLLAKPVYIYPQQSVHKVQLGSLSLTISNGALAVEYVRRGG